MLEEGILLRIDQIQVWKRELEMLFFDENESYPLMKAKKQYSVRVQKVMKKYEQEVTCLRALKKDSQLSIAGGFLRFNMR